VATAVEDDDEVAEVTGEMLDAIGLDVTRATGAQAALNVLSGDQQFSLIFSDIMMPGGMNGIQLAGEVRRRYGAIPLLLTSGTRPPSPIRLRISVCGCWRSLSVSTSWERTFVERSIVRDSVCRRCRSCRAASYVIDIRRRQLTGAAAFIHQPHEGI